MGFVFCFFFMEETNFDRHSILADEAQLAEATIRRDSHVESKTHDDKSVGLDEDFVEQLPSGPRGPKKTYAAKLKLVHRPKTLKHFWFGVLRPLRLLRFPIIFYCGFMYGGSLIFYTILNATSSIILSGAPYHFAP